MILQQINDWEGWDQVTLELCSYKITFPERANKPILHHTEGRRGREKSEIENVPTLTNGGNGRGGESIFAVPHDYTRFSNIHAPYYHQLEEKVVLFLRHHLTGLSLLVFAQISHLFAQSVVTRYGLPATPIEQVGVSGYIDARMR